MIRARLKSGLKKGLKKVLRVDITGPQPDYGLDAKHRAPTASPPLPAATPTDAPSVERSAPAPEPEVAPVPNAAVEPAAVEPAAVEPAAVEPAAVEPATVQTPTDAAGPPLTMDAVQEILDDMVRPALQGDGGDITLIKIEDDNIYVTLVGSCSSCPSSIMTMKMGVEALLKEEFPVMKELIQVD